MRRYLTAGLCTLALSGCALPVPIQVASWALDGLSFLATQKSMTDHGISFVMEKDCAIWRGVTDGQVCRSNSASGPMLADAAALPEKLAATPKRQAAPIPAAPDDNTIRVSASSLVGPAEAEPKQGVYFVIGSFHSKAKANQLAASHEGLRPAVLRGRLDNGNVYRVVVGPVPHGQEMSEHRRLNSQGLRHNWAIRIDPATWRFARLPTAPSEPPSELAILRTK